MENRMGTNHKMRTRPVFARSILKAEYEVISSYFKELFFARYLLDSLVFPTKRTSNQSTILAIITVYQSSFFYSPTSSYADPYTLSQVVPISRCQMDTSPKEEHTETSLSRLPKRQKILHDGNLPIPRRDNYTVAWICALPIEMAAAQAVLDEIHEPLPTYADDTNTYVLGSIRRHNVVIACLPTDQYGIINAANVVTNMKRTFTATRVGLMVGIGGGVPSKIDLRLGYIVVGMEV